MSIKAGLVGLPNAGKSTLFNALTKSSIPAENYPFCTIEPHEAITYVPDPRREKLKKIYNSNLIIPAQVMFVDIAGLVKGAAAGEGLGNQFLGHIREVDLLIHVLRCFENPNIIHTNAQINPLDDFEIIVSELMLKDLESVSKRLERLPKLIKTTADAKLKKELEQEFSLLTQLESILNKGNAKAAQELVHNSVVKTIPLLSTKNFIVVANIAEDELENPLQNKHYVALINQFGKDKVIPISAKTEMELAQLTPQESAQMMELLAITESGIDKIIRTSYEQLGLITFFTCGPKEIHSWTIKNGTTARQAAGEIHSDLERGFICAEVIHYPDLITYGSEAKIKEIGKMVRAGQEYIVQDGDILNIRFNV